MKSLNFLILAAFVIQVLLNQLEEPHQLVLLRQPALIPEYRSLRVWHARQFPILVVHEARVNALELYVLVGSRFQYQIHGFIGAEQNPRSAQVDIEFSGMFFAEDVGGQRVAGRGRGSRNGPTMSPSSCRLHCRFSSLIS